MYDLESAAIVLDKAKQTVRSWMKRFNIKGTLLESDRTRLYITDEDMMILVGHAKRKWPGTEIKEDIIKRYRIADEVVDKEQLRSQGIREGEMHSLTDVALIFGVKSTTVRLWIKKYNIETVRMGSGKVRIYLSYNDVIMLAQQYGHRAPYPEAHNIVEEVKEMRQQIKALTAEVEDIKHDLIFYVKRSIYVGKG